MNKKIIQSGGRLHPIALILAIILVIILILYLFNTWRTNKDERDNETWPPYGAAACPDYWVNQGKGVCANPFKVGVPNCSFIGNPGKIDDPNNPGQQISTMDFSGGAFSGYQGNMAKCRWSQACQVPWEGISHLCA